jgi:hypothetical protein
MRDRSDRLINRLMRLSVETGLLASLLDLAMLITVRHCAGVRLKPMPASSSLFLTAVSDLMNEGFHLT